MRLRPSSWFLTALLACGAALAGIKLLLPPRVTVVRPTREPAVQRAQTLAQSLGIADQLRKLPKQLSGGQSQRVAIARALANDPPLIVADEPTGNLDTVSSANVQSIIRALAHTHGRAVVAVTHDAAFTATADRILTIVDGRLQT